MNASRATVLIIGGYGFFGRRLAARLAVSDVLSIVIAGRNPDKAQALAAALRIGAGALITTMRLDIDTMDIAKAIRAGGIDIVVHTAGPFQGQDYRVARACIEARAHYVDLADGRAFVQGVVALDEAARSSSVLVTSGASSVPSLSSAAVDMLASEFASIESIDIGISPGNRTERGLATVRGILGYCGVPFSAVRSGRPTTVHGWLGLRRHRYPEPVGMRWLSDCNVPDLALFPQRYPNVQAVRFRAGLELPVLHFGMAAMAWLRRAGVVADWSQHAGLLKRISEWTLRFGTDAGAMHVTVSGTDSNRRPIRRCWTLLATDGDGPYVPTLAAAALVGKLARNALTITGATPCIGLLTMKDFDEMMCGLHISTTVSDSSLRS